MCLSHNGFCTNVLHAYKNGHKVISYFALFTRDTVLARELAMGLCLCHVCVCVCVCLSHAGIVSKRLQWTSCSFAHRFASTLCYIHCVLGKIGIAKNKSTLLWNFVPKSELRKYGHHMPTVAIKCDKNYRQIPVCCWPHLATTVDVASVTVDHMHTRHPVLCTAGWSTVRDAPSRGSISVSWYLFMLTALTSTAVYALPRGILNYRR